MKIKLILSIVLFTFVSIATKAKSFPERCEGIWKGRMLIWNKGIVTNELNVEMVIQKTNYEINRWIWKTSYFGKDNAAPIVKDYTLVQRDSTNGTYAIDEGDGIELLNYVFGDKMFCVFTYKRTLLTASYELVGENLIFEVTSGEKLGRAHKKVGTYSTDFLQRVIFTKVE